MNKKLIAAIALCTFSLTSSLVIANLLHRTPNMGAATYGNTILYVSITGRTDGYDEETGERGIKVEAVSQSVGYSTIAPCTDLSTTIYPDRDLVLLPGGIGYSSDDLVEDIGIGATCIKMAAIKNGKIYSTGKIRLFFDDYNFDYTDAKPEFVSIRLPE